MKLPKKSIVLAVSLIGAGAVIGGGATYGALKASGYDKIRSPISAPAPVPEDPVGIASAINRDDKLPEGTISPFAVASDPLAYKDKPLKLRGLVAESSSGQYSLASQKTDEPLGIRLDFSKSKIDPVQYANTSKKTANPVTVTGTLAETKNPAGNFIYVVTVESVTN